MDNILEKIRLAEGVELIPVKEINDLPQLKDIEFDIDDFVLNKPKSRHRSKLVTKDMATLLKQFEKPTTIVDAILSYATSIEQDPTQLLEDAYPFIMDLVKQELLVFNWDSRPVNIFKPGDEFEGYTIIRNIQKIEDTEVFEAFSETAECKNTIIKIGIEKTKEKRLQINFENEALILRHLSNTINPKLISQGQHEEHPYLMIEKIENTPILDHTKRLQRKSEIKELITILKEIVTAYNQLHKEGVLHVDINPRNILITPESKIFIIDFGLSSFTDATYTRMAGIDYFSPPEVISMLNGQRMSKWDLRCEQYSIAALLYYLFTSNHYINFSSDGEEMRRQLLDDPPLSFPVHGLPSFEGLEKIFRKALQKKPEDRYHRLDEMIAELEALDLSSFPAIIQHNYAFDDLSLYNNTDDLIAALGNEKNMREYFNRGPSCSIFCGGAGIAYFLYRLSLHTGSAEMIALADVWNNRTKEMMTEENAFTNKDLQFEEKDVDKISVFNHEPGLHFVQALISNSIGDAGSSLQSIEKLLALSKIETSNLDMTMGKSSILLAMALIFESLPAFFHFDKESIINYGNSYMNHIWQNGSFQKPIQEDYTVKYTGIAHGWSGFIYAALRWHQVTKTPVPEWLERKIEEFIDVREEHKELITWKNKINTRYFHYMPGWCNGSAGFLQFFSMAGGLLKKDAYITIAEKIAVDVYNSPSTEPSLCCGLAGRSYAMLGLYKETKQEKYYDQAKELMLRSKENHSFLKTDSLFKGKFGLKLVECEIEHPETIVFPCM
jgi:eukaryotic-like serine/threonine-protein kinase